MLFCLGTCQRSCEKKFLTHDFCGKFANLLEKTFFFLRSPAFYGKFAKVLSEEVFFREHFRVVSLVPWPRAFLSLALREVCPRKMSSWPRIFFILGLEPCVLDSTSGKVLTVTAIKRSVFLILCCHQDFVIGRDDEGRTSGRECGAGYWNPARNPRKAQGRLIPDCTTAAMQINKNFNKTTAALFWTAPKCGCIYIR